MFVIYYFFSVHLSDWLYWCLLALWKGETAYPSSHSGNRNGLYVSAVGFLATIQVNTQGTKTQLVCKVSDIILCWDLSVHSLLTEAVFLSELYSALQPKKQGVRVQV